MEIFKFFSYKDILDILGVSVIVYTVLYFLRITKGMQILKGLILIAIVWAIAFFLDLKAVSTIFEKFWTVGLFSLIVIFQPEIRKALTRLGQATKFSPSSSVEERVIERIVRACSFMSERQIGALIVIERNQDLEPLLEGCVKLDAIVSIELIITLFDPLTPLHDGAVVIKGDRIAYASCVLPLSKSQDIPKKYGTRHRAGLGISEESDAVSIIVSEETGEISVAVGGKLHRNLDPEGLKLLLFKELGVNK
ncbi:diadenylate cyclase CdaA [Thermocrinis jamiesonii]|uniref:diadenylate cyclase CdaA n=1 Tax=Thermocrinis jamiesonii TaxID=1302351 RepID=UPI0004965D74|nr:diadenylate cyclase CdaA [Thermocrinis jamiesonii]